MVLKLKGITGFNGVVKGRIRKVLTIGDVKKVSNEDIIVVKDNSPLLSLAFLKAKAIISEKGGLLSHLAIVAREMNKPCLLGVEKASSILKDGDKVVLDCKNGEVIVENEY